MPHRIISDVYLLKKTWSVFGKREIIANAVKKYVVASPLRCVVYISKFV